MIFHGFTLNFSGDSPTVTDKFALYQPSVTPGFRAKNQDWKPAPGKHRLAHRSIIFTVSIQDAITAIDNPINYPRFGLDEHFHAAVIFQVLVANLGDHGNMGLHNIAPAYAATGLRNRCLDNGDPVVTPNRSQAGINF